MSDEYDRISYQTPYLAIGFSRSDGSLCQLHRIGGVNILGYGRAIPGVDVALGEYGWLSEYTFARYLGHSWVCDGDDADLTIAIGLGPLKINDSYRIHKLSIVREVYLENVGLEQQVIHGVRLSIPWVRISKLHDCLCEVPGASVRPRVALEIAAEQRPTILPRRFFAPGLRDGRAIEATSTHTPGVLVVRNKISHEQLMCWFIDEDHAALPEIEGNDTAVTLHHTVEYSDVIHVSSNLIPRDRALMCIVGLQYMLITDQLWPAPLADFRSSWLVRKQAIPQEPIAWLRDAAFYETHPGLFGGIDGLIAALPAIAQLGITALCLLPIWAYGSGPHPLWDGEWHVGAHPYALRDLAIIDASLGSHEDMRRMVDAAHELGMRVIVDLPLIGFSPESRYVFSNLHWVRHDMQNRPIRLADIGALACNWSNEKLRDYVITQALEHVQTFGFDGLRLITPRVVQPNWAMSAQARVSAGSLGYAQLADALRLGLEAMSETGAERVLLGDTSGPQGVFLLHAAVDELVQHMFVHAALNRLTPEELGLWLRDHLAALPYAQLRISFTESCRSHAINPLARGLRGSRISRMLLAGLVLCGFIPSVWGGQEDDEGGFIRGLLHMRQEYEVLRSGGLYLNAVTSNNPQVFAVLRNDQTTHILGLLHFDSRKQDITLHLPLDLLNLAPGSYELRTIFSSNQWIVRKEQRMSRDELATIKVTLNPYDVLFLLIEEIAESKNT